VRAEAGFPAGQGGRDGPSGYPQPETVEASTEVDRLTLKTGKGTGGGD
jgi:hypothetical protein